MNYHQALDIVLRGSRNILNMKPRTRLAVGMLAEMVNRQDPVLAIQKNDKRFDCPTCGRRLNNKIDRWTEEPVYRDYYCRHCGQRIFWPERQKYQWELDEEEFYKEEARKAEELKKQKQRKNDYT